MSYVTYVGIPGYYPTNRSARTLAPYYGYSSIEDLADDLPDSSHVIDVGAGFSRFGHEITTLRPDIQWVNFDAVYEEASSDAYVRKSLGKLTCEAPLNLSYLGGNILSPPKASSISYIHGDRLSMPQDLSRQFARVFSYYMLPHVIDLGEEQGVSAVRNMLGFGEVGGKISIGPASDFLGEAQTMSIPSSEEDTDVLAHRYVYSWITQKLLALE